MDFVQGFDRNQLQIMCYEDYVAHDSWARIVDLFVSSLNFQTKLRPVLKTYK